MPLECHGGTIAGVYFDRRRLNWMYVLDNGSSLAPMPAIGADRVEDLEEIPAPSDIAQKEGGKA